MADRLAQPFPDLGNPDQQLYSYLNSLPQQKPKETLGEALMQTWPVKMAQEVLGAATLPGDVYAGRVDPNSEEALRRTLDLAGMATFGSFPVAAVPRAASEVVLGSAATRAAKNVDELRAALSAEHPSTSHWVSESQRGPVTVSKVVVPPEMRNQGAGTQFMRDVIDYADAVGKPVALTPASSFGGNKAKLEAWYRSLGFQPNKGRSADHSISESMVRYPAIKGE